MKQLCKLHLNGSAYDDMEIEKIPLMRDVEELILEQTENGTLPKNFRLKFPKLKRLKLILPNPQFDYSCLKNVRIQHLFIKTKQSQLKNFPQLNHIEVFEVLGILHQEEIENLKKKLPNLKEFNVK